jgi:hypothetical protein
MKRAMPVLLDTLYVLALALWFGLAAGMLVVVSSKAPNKVMDVFARRTGGLIEVAGIAMVGVQFLLRRRYQRDRQAFVADGVRQILTFLALLLAEFARYSLLRTDHAVTADDVVTLCRLDGAQMLVLTVVTALSSWLLVPRTAAGPIVTPASQSNGRPAAPPVAAAQTRQAKPTRQPKRK